MVFSSHGEAESQIDITIKIKCLEDFKAIVNESNKKKEFLNKMNEAYPNFCWAFYHEGTANFIFQD